MLWLDANGVIRDRKGGIMEPISKEDVIKEIEVLSSNRRGFTERQFTGAGLFGLAWAIVYLAKTIKEVIYIRK